MRILALDVGDRRIGVALGDTDGSTAAPLLTLPRRGGDADRRAIADLIRQHQVSLVVIGLPLRAGGEEGTQARRTREFGERLAGYLAQPVTFVDEGGSSLEAAERVRMAGGARRRKHGRGRADIDAAAAVIILERYLERHSGGQL